MLRGPEPEPAYPAYPLSHKTHTHTHTPSWRFPAFALRPLFQHVKVTAILASLYCVEAKFVCFAFGLFWFSCSIFNLVCLFPTPVTPREAQHPQEPCGYPYLPSPQRIPRRITCPKTAGWLPHQGSCRVGMNEVNKLFVFVCLCARA